uniref:Uncharacterized protein n=1 Tax=Kalanchoe fedtschenkoi TaxID=63787 RepID=A0A7N0U2P6_KALFE
MISQVSYLAQSSVDVGCYANGRSQLLKSVKVGWFQRSRYVHSSRLLSAVASQSATVTAAVASSKISRAARAEAQAVLFDYLQNTRSLQFADADHISRNSERFLVDLLAKVDSEEQGVTKSLSRYLRFNPINEFEPFFESLGLTPTEYYDHLPRELMYLSDDQLMLDNFHELCDYGIPRSKIGKIYAEAESVFRYEYGMLASKFRAYEKLGLSKSAVIKFVTCDPTLLVGDVNTKFVDFLRKLKKLGLRNDWLAGYLSAENSYDWARMSETVEVFDKMGFGSGWILMIFEKEPGLILENSGKAIHVLIGHLFKLGFKKDEVVALFLQDPKLMSKKCLKNLSDAMCFLFEIGMKLEDIAHVVQTHRHILSSNSPKRPRTVMATLKVGETALCKMIKKDPTKLYISASTPCSEEDKAFSYTLQAPARCLEKTTFLKWLGYAENSEEFLQAAKRFRGRGDQLQERFNCLAQSGLDYNSVADMVKRVPQILNQSKDVLEQKIYLLTHVIGYPLESLVTSPTYLCYDVKRINLRFSMYMWLRERGVAKPAMALSTILGCSDERFVRYFVDIHPNGAAAWERLKESAQAEQTEV